MRGLTFGSTTKSLSEEFNECAGRWFGDTNRLLYAKLQPPLKSSINLSNVKNGTFDEIVTHL